MRIATWNVNSLKARLPLVERWLSVVEPDVLCMQETKCSEESFPEEMFARLGYETVHHGDGRWNGVAVASRVGISELARGFHGDPDALAGERRLVTVECASLIVSSVYVPNGRAVGTEHFEAKLSFLLKLIEHVEWSMGLGKVAVCGDFNVAPADLDVFDPAYFARSTHVTPEERAALDRLLGLGLTDALRHQYEDVGRLFSWWDYRAGDFHKGRGMRIDLILLSKALAPRIEFALIDRNGRKGQGSKTEPQPSDHAPVVVQLSD